MKKRSSKEGKTTVEIISCVREIDLFLLDKRIVEQNDVRNDVRNTTSALDAAAKVRGRENYGFRKEAKNEATKK